MKRVVLFVAVLLSLSSTHVRAEGPTAIAVVDMNRLQNEVDYQRLFLLGASDEVRAEVTKMKASMDQILVESLASDDDAKVALLQNRIQTINNKLNLIRNALGNRNGGRDNRRTLVEYIHQQYGEKYAVIIDAQMIRNNGQMILWNPTQVTDLTDEILKKLDKDLP